MSSKSGETTLGRWLLREEGWAKTHAYKKRKKKTKIKFIRKNSYTYKSQRETTKKTRIFQQLDMEGNNIDEQDGEAFADKMKKKGPETIRIKSQNIKGVPEHPIHFKSRQIVNNICDQDTDGWLVQETGLCWKKVGETGQ
jgi:hypothetical protein